MLAVCGAQIPHRQIFYAHIQQVNIFSAFVCMKLQQKKQQSIMQWSFCLIIHNFYGLWECEFFISAAGNLSWNQV